MGSVKVKVVGARGAAQGFQRAADMLPRDTQDVLEDFGKTGAIPVFRQYAPEASGELKDVMRMEPWEFPGIQIVDDPESDAGFHYMEITRFGHAPGPEDRIYPVHARALRIPGVGFRAWVSRFHPPTDWVDDAIPAIEVRAVVAERMLIAKVAERLG